MEEKGEVGEELGGEWRRGREGREREKLRRREEL